MRYHCIAFAMGFLLDLLFGDPHWLPHPIRLIGRWIEHLKKWNEPALTGRQKQTRGAALVLVVVLGTVLCFGGLLWCGYLIHPVLGCMVEAVMSYQILAMKCLKVESMKVYERLAGKDLPGARTAVSMIVGRDTQCLDESGVAKAAVETVAENTSDGVIAPMLYLAIGGPVLGFFYKAVNTMDSMIGYKNEEFLYFGRCAAKLDDVMNFLPSRISALLMILVSLLPGRDFDGKRAWRIWRRDRLKHASPNSAQTEAACAGSLGVQLAGNASYFGKIVEKPTIGDDTRPVVYEDIRRANGLMYRTAFLGEILCLLVLFILEL